MSVAARGRYRLRCHGQTARTPLTAKLSTSSQSGRRAGQVCLQARHRQALCPAGDADVSPLPGEAQNCPRVGAPRRLGRGWGGAGGEVGLQPGDHAFDSSVELGGAVRSSCTAGGSGQAPFDAGHADQDHAHVVPVVVVADLLQPGGLEPVGLVDDEQLRQPGRQGLGMHERVDVAMPVVIDGVGDLLAGPGQGLVDLLGGRGDSGRPHCGADVEDSARDRPGNGAVVGAEGALPLLPGRRRRRTAGRTAFCRPRVGASRPRCGGGGGRCRRTRRTRRCSLVTRNGDRLMGGGGMRPANSPSRPVRKRLVVSSPIARSPWGQVRLTQPLVKRGSRPSSQRTRAAPGTTVPDPARTGRPGVSTALSGCPQPTGPAPERLAGALTDGLPGRPGTAGPAAQRSWLTAACR